MVEIVEGVITDLNESRLVNEFAFPWAETAENAYYRAVKFMNKYDVQVEELTLPGGQKYYKVEIPRYQGVPGETIIRELNTQDNRPTMTVQKLRRLAVVAFIVKRYVENADPLMDGITPLELLSEMAVNSGNLI